VFFKKLFKKKPAQIPAPFLRPDTEPTPAPEPVKPTVKEHSLPASIDLHSYDEIEAVVRILTDDGFAVSSVRTYGECSSHDFVDAFSREYSSIEEFQKNVYTDYAENLQRCMKYGPELSWEGTFIKLFNNETGIWATISFSENSPEDSERRSLHSAHVFSNLFHCTDEDMAYFETLAAKLSDFTKNNTTTKKAEE